MEMAELKYVPLVQKVYIGGSVLYFTRRVQRWMQCSVFYTQSPPCFPLSRSRLDVWSVLLDVMNARHIPYIHNTNPLKLNSSVYLSTHATGRYLGKLFSKCFQFYACNC